MAFTQDDADELRRAVASGALTVTRGSEMVTYRNLAEMRSALRMIEDELGGSTKRRLVATYPTTSRGL